MKDYLHLYGGMIAGIAMLALYIFGWGAAQKCFGAEVVENPQVVLIGDLPQTAQPVLIGDLQQPQPFYIPQSGEVVIVGDMQFVMVSLGDWQRWTNAVARLEAVAERRWANEHKTDAGRRAWHGALKERKQSEDGRGIVFTYADGFTYTEEAPPAPKVSPAVRRMKSGATAAQGASKPSGGTRLPPRLEAKQKALKARPAVREVNATFGPGGKVLNVEGER